MLLSKAICAHLLLRQTVFVELYTRTTTGANSLSRLFGFFFSFCLANIRNTFTKCYLPHSSRQIFLMTAFRLCESIEYSWSKQNSKVTNSSNLSLRISMWHQVGDRYRPCNHLKWAHCTSKFHTMQAPTSSLSTRFSNCREKVNNLYNPV